MRNASPRSLHSFHSLRSRLLFLWPVIAVLFCVVSIPLHADEPSPKPKPEKFDYQAAIDDLRVDELQQYLGWLAAPEQEGRNSGTEAGHRAGDYLVMQLALLELKPAGTDGSYTQGFRFRDDKPRYRNVLGIIPGSDPVLADEYIMICAHYDHVGVIGGNVYPGANDNASGTSMILELAESLQKLEPRAKRSIIVAFWDAEEKGLLGSGYFADNPTVPLEKIRGVFNFDMVGTLQNDKFEVFGSNIATGMREFISRLLAEGDPNVDFSTEYLLASDHSSFYSKKIPALMFFTGLDCPYHVPEDTYDIINFEGMKQIADIAFRIVFRLADTDDLAFVKYISPREVQRDNEKQAESGWFRPAEAMGLIFETSGDSGAPLSTDVQRALGKMLGRAMSTPKPGNNRGLRVTNVVKGSLAERLGFQRGDRIMTFNGRDIADDFDETMSAAIMENPSGMVFLRISRSSPEPKEWLRFEISPDDLAEVNRGVRQGFLYWERSAEPDTFIVSEVFSDKAREADLQWGDRIMHINGNRASTESLREAVSAQKPLLLEIERNGRIFELELAL